jgi:hypothetical protein
MELACKRLEFAVLYIAKTTIHINYVVNVNYHLNFG